jgi:hypothetical protein
MTCHRGFATKKSQAPRQAQLKTRKLAVQMSSKEIGATNNDERGGYSPMTAFPNLQLLLTSFNSLYASRGAPLAAALDNQGH